MKVINILLVEDDDIDAMHIKRAFDKMQIVYKLHLARNGEDAIRLLNGEEFGKVNTLPDVLLIDIKTPGMNSLELLSIVREKEEWKHLKSYIITTSEEKVDKEEAENLGISGFIVKPLKLSNPSSMDVFNLFIDLMNMKN